MVSHEAADVFVYDALSNAAIRKLLFDRKVESRQVYVEDYQLGMAGNSDLTLLRGKGITVGEVFRLYPEEEIDLVKKFMNRSRKQSVTYELVPLEVNLSNPDNNRAPSVAIEVLTPIITATTVPIEGLDPKGYGFIRGRDMRPVFKAARMVRAQYLANSIPPSLEVLATSL